MISTPDFRHKQVVFLNTADFSKPQLSFRNENIVVSGTYGTIDKVPLHRLLAVFIAGETTLTSKLMEKCMANGASLFLLKRNLATYASIGAYAEGNYLLRQKQYALEEEQSIRIAKKIVENKLVNHLALLRSVDCDVVRTRTRLAYKKIMKEKIQKAKDLGELRGVEGLASKDFFQAYFSRINWHKRIPRGKIDENNILLDMGYSFLFNFVDSILRLYGFDTYKGVYHQLFYQRKSLSCDIMEPFRCIVERALVKMHTLGQFDEKDFSVRKGVYGLQYQKNNKYARIFLKEIMNYKMEIHQYVRAYYYLVLNNEGEMGKFIIR
ncbi:MAG: type V CRISPR-associated endonuclease Cas1 [Candidatus Moranbacteria bacterium]|nr:type V CRISPR-associated endonuclease Cas1 [Candidatus Moranbacteria bacterium]